MAAAVIGALRVVLGADTAAFESGLKGAEGSLAKFHAGAVKAAAAIGAGIGAAAVGLALAIKGSLNEADKLGKLAQSVGVPVEELSRLKHAADLSGVSVEDLAKSMGKLSKSMSLIAGGAENDVSRAFKALHISVKNSDGTLKSSTQVMTEVAGKFGKMEDGAGKTALAMAIFGKSGAALIPMLNGGAAGLKEMMDEADKLGIVIDSKTAKSAEAFNDNLTRLGKVKDAIVLKIAAGMLPAMESLSAAMVQTAKDSSALQTVGETLGASLKVLASIAQGVSTWFRSMAMDFNAVASAISLVAQGEFTKALEVFKNWQVESKKLFEDSNSAISKMWAPADEIAANAPETAKKLAAPIILADKNLGQTIADIQFKTRVLRQDFKNLAEGFPEAAHGLKLFGTSGTEARTSVELLTPALQKLNAAQLAFKGAQITQENLTPWQLYEQQIARINQLLAAGVISQETYARATEAAAVRAGMSWGANAASISGSFAEIASSFGTENVKMAKAAQILGAVQALISTLVAQAEALKLPFPANLVAVAAIAAKGFALVAAIKSQKIPKAQTGASFTIPGGMGGADSKMVPIMGFPGERVTVDPPRRPGAAGDGRNVMISLVGKIFNRPQVEELIGQINEALRDGHRLRVAPA